MKKTKPYVLQFMTPILDMKKLSSEVSGNSPKIPLLTRGNSRFLNNHHGV